MNKKRRIVGGTIIVLCTLIEFIIIITQFGSCESSSNYSKDTVFGYVEQRFDENLMSTQEVMKYEQGDVFRIANYKDTEAKLTYKDGERLKIGDLHVIHNATSSGTELISREKVSNSAIEYDISAMGMIVEIIRNENNVQFCGNYRQSPLADGFFGFYYSLDGSPQMVVYYEDGDLTEDGDGWSYSANESNYYTEHIKEQFYYYEGT